MPAKGFRNGKEVACVCCGKLIYKTKTQLSKRENHYCSRNCRFKHFRFSEESLNKMSNSHIGQIAWNVGLTKKECPQLKGNKNKVKVAWNRGLTKDTNVHVKKASDRLKMIYLFKPKQVSHRKGITMEEEYGIEKAEEIKQKNREKRIEQKFSRQSSIELILIDKLSKKDLKFEVQYPYKFTQMDIAFPEQKIAIYCDGDYWHNLPSYKIRDFKINKLLKEQGWTVLRFWEHDIHNNLEGCINKIEENLNV